MSFILNGILLGKVQILPLVERSQVGLLNLALKQNNALEIKNTSHSSVKRHLKKRRHAVFYSSSVNQVKKSIHVDELLVTLMFYLSFFAIA